MILYWILLLNGMRLKSHNVHSILIISSGNEKREAVLTRKHSYVSFDYDSLFGYLFDSLFMCIIKNKWKILAGEKGKKICCLYREGECSLKRTLYIPKLVIMGRSSRIWSHLFKILNDIFNILAENFKSEIDTICEQIRLFS